MFKKISKRLVALVLAVMMVITVVPLQMPVDAGVSEYADFMTKFKQLEAYADEYAAAIIGRDPGELVLNFIRTGVERYQDDNWETLAGVEIVGFTAYVEEQDAKAKAGEPGYENKVKDVMSLRDIEIDNFILPNGNKVDFGHMFGCMNISYVNKGSADLSGWAGDICDLLQYCVYEVKVPSGKIDEMAAYIQEECFGVSASGAFGWDDFWGDMDAYYLVSQYQKAGGSKKFSTIMEAYFTADLDDTDRTVYFMNNRFGVADNKDAVRRAIYEAYAADISVKILESKRGVSSYTALREACCYAVADYIYSQAKGHLVEGSVSNETAKNGYYTVFSNEHSTLAPGITQDINYAQTVDGKQIVYYVATVDVTQPDVTIMVNYKDNEPPVAGKHIGLQRVEDQVAALVEKNKDKGNFYPIVATNGAGYNISNGTPSGLVVMQGVEYYPVGAPGFFAILKDGTAMIGTEKEYTQHKEQIQEGIAAFGAVLVKDGKINVTKNANYTSSRASRTAIGITAEGKVVMMVLDGRQFPFSAGGAMEEIAQIMLEAGCVNAVNLDGGGSTTYMSKPAGSDKIGVVNRPSDGYARSVATSLVAISTAAPSTAFDHAIISSDYEYITAGTTMQFKVTGVSNTGNAAPIPEGSHWRVSNSSIGTIDANGLFTAVKNGSVDVEYVVNGEVEGKVTVGVVTPDSLSMESSSMTAIYGKPATLPVIATYRGNRVCVKDADFMTAIVYDNNMNNMVPVGGLSFTIPTDSTYRTVMAGAVLLANQNLMTYLSVNLYREGETIFDFDNATHGNRTLAWYREITNTHTLDDLLYRISDAETPVEMKYTFALDMKAIDIPARLEPMMGQLPTFQEGASAWDYMLQMANRVCEQTQVTITVDFSKDVSVDISELKIINEFFELSSAVLDENNRLTVICNWIYQSQAINAASANSLCLLTGVKTTLKDTASFYNNEIIISNNGTVSYKIYLAASSLYSFVTNPDNDAQNLYGLYPYIHDPACRIDGDQGAYFANSYADFADTYAISTEQLNGWHEDYYYVNNVPVTGVQLVPDRHDATQKRFCEFDESGKLINEQGMNGLVEFEGNLYHTTLGVIDTSWREVDGKYYYFHPDTGAAVDGKFTITEMKNTWESYDFEYTFEDHVLVKGVWVNDSQAGASGWRYRWAGDWKKGGWFEAEGKLYYATSNINAYVKTGFQRYIPSIEDPTKQAHYLLDDHGALMEDFTGATYIGTYTNNNGQPATENAYLFFVNGRLRTTEGVAQGNDGYYYYIKDWTGHIILSTSKNVTTNTGRGHVPAGTYTFDEYGRLTDNLLQGKTEIADDISKPDGSAYEIITNVMGRVLSVKAEITCKVAYMDANGKYHVIEAMINPYGVSTTDLDAATEYNFTVPADAKEVKVIMAGDLNGNGAIDENDAPALHEKILNSATDQLTDLEKIACDINGDGKFTALDVALINAAEKGKLDLEW